MNDKCKYCDYVSKCSRICEYDSYLCKVHRSFPKVVDKSYEQLQQENKHLDEVNYKLRKTNEQLKDNWNKLKQIIDVKMYNSEYLINLCGYKVDVDTLEILKIIKEEMQELEQGSDSNE